MHGSLRDAAPSDDHGLSRLSRAIRIGRRMRTKRSEFDAETRGIPRGEGVIRSRVRHSGAMPTHHVSAATVADESLASLETLASVDALVLP
jgi:hypothetical protein